MNHKSTMRRCFLASEETENKHAQTPVRDICEKSEKHRSMPSTMVINAFSPAGTRRAPGSIRYFFSLLGQAAKHELEVV